MGHATWKNLTRIDKSLHNQCKDAILRANPGIPAQEVNLRFIELNYGRELADNVRNFLVEKR